MEKDTNHNNYTNKSFGNFIQFEKVNGLKQFAAIPLRHTQKVLLIHLVHLNVLQYIYWRKAFANVLQYTTDS